MPRGIYQARVARIGQETRNMKDGSLEGRTRLHQASLRATLKSPRLTLRVPYTHDAPKGVGLTCFTGIDASQGCPKKNYVGNEQNFLAFPYA